MRRSAKQQVECAPDCVVTVERSGVLHPSVWPRIPSGPLLVFLLPRFRKLRVRNPFRLGLRTGSYLRGSERRLVIELSGRFLWDWTWHSRVWPFFLCTSLVGRALSTCDRLLGQRISDRLACKARTPLCLDECCRDRTNNRDQSLCL